MPASRFAGIQQGAAVDREQRQRPLAAALRERGLHPAQRTAGDDGAVHPGVVFVGMFFRAHSLGGSIMMMAAVAVVAMILAVATLAMTEHRRAPVTAVG